MIDARIKTILRKRFEIPKATSLTKALSSFSLTEKVIFWIFGAVFTGSALLLLIQVNNAFLVTVPDKGGELIEGIIGSPRFANPLLAISDADKDIVSLVYSGLLKATPDGKLIPDLAESYTISEDGKTYDFFLKSEVTFHDGVAVTASDVEFTINKIADPALKSPKRASFDGVIVEKVSEQQIRFTLKQAYAPFLENTTIGILPKHIWKNVTSEEFPFSDYNISPIGSGPYVVKSIGRNNAGIPNSYNLQAFADNAVGEPYITKMILRFYPNAGDLATALDQGDIDSVSGLSPDIVKELVKKGKKELDTTLPRVFAMFFNQNQAPLFTNKEVRQALALSVNKESIVTNILHGYGTAIDGPIPPRFMSESLTEASSTEERILSAKALLEKSGWTMNAETGVYEKKDGKGTTPLSFTLATGDAPELRAVAEQLKSDYAKIGAEVILEIFESGSLNQNVIRPRKYDALLFGVIVGRDHDLYPFWHSSQRNDPGLNVALYVNNTADKLLEQARATNSEEARNEAYDLFRKEVSNDVPAVFLYSPSFLYVVPNKVSNIEIGNLTTNADRFLTIQSWYIETNKVWKIFTQ
jgi:peptide/nickel transport system substrate-binding protein